MDSTVALCLNDYNNTVFYRLLAMVTINFSSEKVHI